MKTHITKYGSRNWAIYDPQENLIAVTMYKKGACRVAKLLATLPANTEHIRCQEEIEETYRPQFPDTSTLQQAVAFHATGTHAPNEPSTL